MAANCEQYVHREGTREYLEAEVLPHVRPALVALLHKVQEERLKLAAGSELDDGQFRSLSWRPFCAQEWLANYLLQRHSSTDAGSPAGGSTASGIQQPS